MQKTYVIVSSMKTILKHKRDFPPDFPPLPGPTSWANETGAQPKACLSVSQKETGLLARFDAIFFNGVDVLQLRMLHDEEGLEGGDRGDCAGTFTSFIAGGVETTFSGVEGMEMTFSVVEGEPDLPFLPDGAGIPFGQGFRGIRGLSAVFAETRTDRVLSRKLSGAFLGLDSALEVSAEGFKWGRRSS
jgi:hypothetical protein